MKFKNNKMLDNTICANCGAADALHKFDTQQCPKNGIEEVGSDKLQQWEQTTFIGKLENEIKADAYLAYQKRKLLPTELIRNVEALEADVIELKKSQIYWIIQYSKLKGEKGLYDFWIKELLKALDSGDNRPVEAAVRELQEIIQKHTNE